MNPQNDNLRLELEDEDYGGSGDESKQDILNKLAEVDNQITDDSLTRY